MARGRRAEARGRRRGAGAPGRRRHLRPRPAGSSAGSVPLEEPLPVRPRGRRRGDRGRRRRQGCRARRPRQRPLPGLLRRVRDLPPRPHRQLRAGRADGDLRAADRRELRRLPQRLGRGSRSPTRCWSRCPTASSRPSIASLSDNIPDAWRTVGPQLEERARARRSWSARGAGSIALYAVADRARARRRAGRLRRRQLPDLRERAESLGANLLDEEFPKRLGPYPITVDASGTHEGLACALRSTAPEGICTIIAIYFEPRRPRCRCWRCTRRGSASTPAASTPAPRWSRCSTWSARGSFEPERVTGETAAWDDAAEAVAGHRSKLVISRG